MKLSELREKTDPGCWENQAAMTWTLKWNNMRELRDDIEKALTEATRKGRLQTLESETVSSVNELADWRSRKGPASAGWALVIGHDNVSKLLVDIEQRCVQAYNNGFRDGMDREKQNERVRQVPLHAIVTQPMRESDDAPVGVWPVAQASFPKIAYSCEEVDAKIRELRRYVESIRGSAVIDGQDRLKMLTEKLFSAVQRIEVLERQVKENDERRHFGEGELRGYVQELGRDAGKLRELIEAQPALYARIAELERMHEGQPEKTTKWEKQTERRLDALEEKREPWGANASEMRQALTARLRAVENGWHEHQRAIEELNLNRQRSSPAADGALGVELSKIRDRLNSLENRNVSVMAHERLLKLEEHPERLGSSEKHSDRRIEALERNVAGHEQRIGDLDARFTKAGQEFVKAGELIGESCVALKWIPERIEYLEKQERNTLDVFNEQRGLIERLERRVYKLEASVGAQLGNHAAELRKLDERTVSLRQVGTFGPDA